MGPVKATKMKPRIFIFCSVLVVGIVGLSLTISCGPSGNSEIAKAGSPSPDATGDPDSIKSENDPRPPADTTNVNTDEDSPLSGAFQAGDLKIVSVEPTEGSFAYPQIDAPRTSHERSFNRYVLKLISKNLEEYKKAYKANETETDDYRRGKFDDNEYSYSVYYVTPEFVSMDLIYSFCGASCHAEETPVNYDLIAGKPIKNLAELFMPQSGYLKTIASYCVAELKRNGDDCLGDKWFENGTKPTASNYEHWSLGRDGVSITFPQYQTGPGACPGGSVVVPYNYLNSILRKDVGWFRRLQPNSISSPPPN